jgi:hypothetical protein
MNSFQDPIHAVIVGQEPVGWDDIDLKFDLARQYIESHWTRFEDPSGVAADLAELRRAVSEGRPPANLIRTRLTLHRLNRITGNAAPVAAVIAIVREMLETAH